MCNNVPDRPEQTTSTNMRFGLVHYILQRIVNGRKFTFIHQSLTVSVMKTCSFCFTPSSFRSSLSSSSYSSVSSVCNRKSIKSDNFNSSSSFVALSTPTPRLLVNPRPTILVHNSACCLCRRRFHSRPFTGCGLTVAVLYGDIPFSPATVYEGWNIFSG